MSGTPGRIRTCGLRIRSPTLYPAELRAHGRTDKRRSLVAQGRPSVKSVFPGPGDTGSAVAILSGLQEGGKEYQAKRSKSGRHGKSEIIAFVGDHGAHGC